MKRKTDTMNAKKMFRKELKPADGWTEQTLCFDFEDVTEFAERYHQAKLKLLGITDVVEQSEQLRAFAQFLYEKEYLVRRSVDEALNEFESL